MRILPYLTNAIHAISICYLHLYIFTSTARVYMYEIEVGMSYTDKNESFPIQILNMKGKCVVKVLCVAAHTFERGAFFKPFARVQCGLWN